MKQVIVDVPSPFGGLDQTSGFADSKKGTTRNCINVWPQDSISGRSIISRRAGTDKYLDTQIASGPIQCIDTVVIARDQRLGTGDLLCQGATTATFNLRTQAAGTTITMSGVSAMNGEDSLGCCDEDGNFYVATASSSGTATVRVQKVGTDYASKWTVDITPGSSNNPQIFGIQAVDGYVYVWVVSASASAVTSPGIYRLASADGSGSLTVPWMDSSDGLATVSGTQGTARQCLAAGGGLLGVVGVASTVLVLQQIVIATQVVAHTYTLQNPFVSHHAKVVTDSGANFYVLTNTSGAGTSLLFKINWAGVIPAAFNSGASVSISGAKDIAYNPVTFGIGVVGTALTGGTDSFRIYDATAGTLFGSGAKHDTFNWDAIASDDQTTSRWRLRRSVAAGSVDIVSVDQPGGTDLWTATSNLGVVTPTLWLACSGVQVAPSSTTMRSTRLTRGIACVNGGLYRWDDGVANITANFVSGAAPVVWAARNGLTLYFVDGSSAYPYYNASTNTAGLLTASAGSLPGYSGGQRCRLICTWRGRLVMAGLNSEPQNWFMSAVDDPTDWDYSPVTTVATQAIAGNNAPAGLCPDSINCLIPYSDDILIFGCDHSIYMMQGDPMAGGRIDLVTDGIGMAWGRPFCKGPDGMLYFFSSRGGVYSLRPGPGAKPQRISDKISKALLALNVGDHIFRMAWDEDLEGFHLFVCPLTTGTTTTHYFWEQATRSWWPMTFVNTNHDPLAVHTHDGDDPNDRVVLFGSRTGYLMFLNPSQADDDGSVIGASIDFGPIYDKDGLAFNITDLQVTMSSGSSTASYEVRSGESVEAAYNASSAVTGTFSSGRNRSQAIRVRGHAAFIEISGSAQWALEDMKVVIEPLPVGVSQRAW